MTCLQPVLSSGRRPRTARASGRRPRSEVMRRRRLGGSACIEFAFVVMVLVPLFLGTGAAGINMILTLQTIQVARDAGHMYARGLDFSQPGNKTILANLGQTLGLSTTARSEIGRASCRER